MRYILISGARDYPQIDHAIFLVMEAFDRNGTILIHGNARGIDRNVAEAFTRHVELNPILKGQGSMAIPFRAEWTKYGRAAGPIRNEEMVRYVVDKLRKGHEVVTMAFPLEPRQPHSGTWDCIDRMYKWGFDPLVVPATLTVAGVD